MRGGADEDVSGDGGEMNTSNKDELGVVNLDDRTSWCILLLFLESQKNEWINYRDRVCAGTISEEELFSYFENAIEEKVPKYKLSIGTSLFRARQIKSKDWNDLGKSSNQIYDEYSKILLTENEIQSLNNKDINVTLEFYLNLKMYATEELDESKRKQIEAINEKYSRKDFYGYLKNGCGVPPLRFRKDGRLSSAEDSYLYLAMDAETAIHEVRPSIGQFYSLAECKTVKPVCLADLCVNFNAYADVISEPNIEDDVSFYRITQSLAHFLQKKGYSGILYKSAQRRNKQNVLLFDESDVEFVASEIVSIDDVSVSMKRHLPLLADSDGDTVP